MHKDVEHFDFDVLEADTLIRLFPAPVLCGSKVLRVVADDVFVDYIAFLLGTDEDRNDFAHEKNYIEVASSKVNLRVEHTSPTNSAILSWYPRRSPMK
jgi:hypothetical protein